MKAFVNKLIKPVLILTMLFVFFSCKNTANNQEAFSEQKQDEQIECPMLQVSIKDIDTEKGRTVLPLVPDVEELTDIKIQFFNVNNFNINNPTAVFGPYESLESLPILKLPIEFLDKEYHIFFISKVGDLTFYGQLFYYKVTAGVNELEFKLSLEDYGQGNGNLSYQIDFSGASNKNDVKLVKAQLQKYNSKDNPWTNFKQYSFSGTDIKNYSVTIKDQLPAGSYKILVSFYASTENDTLRLTDVPWQEVIHIASGLKSEKTQKIDDFNTTCHITYDLNLAKYGINSSQAINFNPVNIVLQKTPSTILENPSINGYYFLGWYEDESFEYKCPEKINSDITLYARWVNLNPTDGSHIALASNCVDVISSNTNGTPENPAVIRIVGEIVPNTMTLISSQLFNNLSSYYVLDFTDAYGVTSITYGKFMYRSNLVGITLNDEITEIGSFAFYGCSSLKEFTIGKNVSKIGEEVFCVCGFEDFTLNPDNPFFAYIDGVLYEKENNECKRAIIYPVKNAVNNVTIPDTVTKIDSYAFDHSKITGLVIPDSVTTIGGYAFESCEDLESLSIGKGVSSFDNVFQKMPKLSSITVSNQNNTFKVQNGVLYSKDGKVLYIYPAKNTATSFIIPADVTVINDYAFYGAENLSDITFADKDNFWLPTLTEYRGSTYVDLTQFLIDNFSKRIEGTISGSDFVDTIKGYDDYYFYKFDMQYFKNTAADITSKVTTVDPVKVGQTEDGKDIIKYDNTFVDVISSNKNEVYRIDNAKGRKYRFNWMDWYNSEKCGYYTNYPDNLEDCSVYVFDGSGTKIASIDDDPYFDYLSSTDTIFIIPIPRDYLACAFRIQDITDVNLNITLKVDPLSDITDDPASEMYIKTTKDNTGITFELLSGTTENLTTTDAKWYVDGVEKESGVSTFTLNYADYFADTYTVTFRCKEYFTGKWYSYNAELTITE